MPRATATANATAPIAAAVALLGLVMTASSAQAATIPVDLQPSSVWAVAGSGIGPACDNPPSPAETDWAESAGDGVTLSVAGTNIQCCDCIRRSARFAVDNLAIAGTHLTGKFDGQNTGTYSAASFRVILFAGTSDLGRKAYATQQRANNNCVGQSEEPLTIVNSGATFDIDLSTVNNTQNSTFDGFEIEVLGYACPDGTGTTAAATAILSDVSLVTTDPDGGTTALTPTASPGVTSPFKNGPDVADAGASASSSSGGAAGPYGTASSPGASGGGGSSGCSLGSGPAAPATGGLVLAAAALILARRRRS
jgi:MYXO-CTERM domain-containing protein